MLKLKRLYDTIEYNGATWYYVGKSIPDDCSEIYYDYCNYPMTKNKCIRARTKDIKFIHFRSKFQLVRKQSNPKSPEQMKREIFNSIADYRKKHKCL